MTMRPFQVFKQFLSVWVLFAVILAGSLRGEDAQGEYAFYTSPHEGTSYVAVGMRGVQIPSTATNEVVFLVDTSASQFGQTRHDTLSTLAAAIDNLSASTQIQILVMDVETESLTSGFVQKGSVELNSALLKLQRRVPLGATDMSRGLEMAKKAFAGRNTEARRAVVYFGNGRSMAKTVDVSVFEAIVKDYYSARIPFNACAVGIGTNLGLIGALTNQTGGNLIDMNTKIRQGMEQAAEQGEILAQTKAKAENRKIADVEREITITMPNFTQSIGKQIADSITATIVWPYQDSYSFPADWEVYPKTLQPIRSDRETIIVGKTDAETLPTFTLKLKGATAGNEIDLAWNFSPNNEPGASAGNNFLAAVVDIAAKDNGLTMPIVGWESLALIQEGFIVNITEQINRADAAIKTGNRNQAMKILDNVLRIDPTNKTAKRLHITAEKSIEGEPAKIEDDSEGEKTGSNGVIYRPARYVTETAVEDETSGTVASNPKTSFVDAVTIEQSIASQKIQNEVKQTINDATSRMNDDPEGALQNLKLSQAMVRDNTSLSPDQRNAMLDRIGNTIRQVQNVQYQTEFERAEADANDAAQRDRLVVLHDLQERRDKAIQIFNRFASLMEAKEYKIATSVAGIAAEILPESTTPFAAQRFAEMTSYIVEYAELRHRRHVGFLECLMQTERSFIPVPEEPPLTYIEPERWLLLSERRKERYAVSDLSQSGAAEKKISKALERSMDMDLDENTTFEDLFNMINDKNPGINLDIDSNGAGNLGITLSSPVVRERKKYNGLKLRSILRLILRDQDLTYCVKDEVLLITSEEEAKKYMSVKVYPMADLVVPTSPISGGMSGMSGMGGGGMGGMMNGGGMGGGMGGMGGGMGGMGGGMGGMGGGMGGMGGGGGMFSIPDEVQKDTPASVPTNIPVNTPAKVSTDSADLSTQAKQIVTKANDASDLSAFWDAFFAPKSTNDANIDEALVKEIGHRLLREMKAQKSAEYKVESQVVAFVESAILNDAMQPWMYEALAISLYRKNAPVPEIERAVLSAADFCENPIDLMNVGVFMRSLGMKQKSFPLYKQALENLTPKLEFYSATLRLAQELKEEFKDEESLRWIALAILSQEWEGILGQKMTTSALDSLQNLEVKMQKAGRNEDAAKLAAEIKEARLRDCVVTIEWTGNAGLDLMVREPTDSYCWNNNPRTLSGGLLKSIPVTDSGKPITGTLTEQSGSKKISYVCPKGFNGRYGIVLRKDWGELTNNMFKISVDSNIVSGEKGREGTMLQMQPEGVIVCFDLETGRRTETAEEGEINVASLRMSVAQQQLARNNALKRLKDDGLLGQIAGNNNGMGSGQSFDTGGTNSPARPYSPYYYGPSAVGYRPVITVLPDGASLMSNAVVSADRRYVRISPSPMFSTIRNVTKYNMAGGSTEDMGGNSGSGIGMF